MATFNYLESQCELSFQNISNCFHLWTPENFSIIFTSDDDFRVGMSIIGLCSKMFPTVRIITFELMSNHIHMVVSGDEETIRAMFEQIKCMFALFVHDCKRTFDKDAFHLGMRRIDSLMDMRNVIIYDNKNGFLVNPSYSPYTYPWGANKYFFNSDAVLLASQNARHMTVREKRIVSHRRSIDNIGNDLMCYDGCVSPISFCAIKEGESFFRDASHYFHMLSRSVETNRKIAKEIGESIFYNDDELFTAISQVARERYNSSSLSMVDAETKVELAKTMFFDYHASPKQIVRMLRIPFNVLVSLGLPIK